MIQVLSIKALKMLSSHSKKRLSSQFIYRLKSCRFLAISLKNPRAQRIENFERFVNKTLDKYFILASATPCPNRLKDLGVLFHLLEPESYPLQEYDYNSNPNAISDFIARGKWLMFTREDLKAICTSLPPIPTKQNGRIKELNIEIPDEYVEKYLELWADWTVDAGAKLMGLRKILLEGMLAADDENCWLRDLLSGIKKEKEQVVIFSYLKKGIINRLIEKAENVYGKDKVESVDGTVPFDRRVELSEIFSQGKLKVIICTTKTMGEGIPLLTYETPVSIIFYEPSFNQGDFDQGIGRCYRIGQIENVSIYITLGVSKKLEEAQKNIAKRLELDSEEEERLRVKIIPGTIHQDINNLREKKTELSEKLIT